MTTTTRLPIEVVDRFSKPLADLQRRLNALEARRNLSDTRGKVADLSTHVRAAAVAVSGGLRSALSGLGLAGFGAAGAIMAVAVAVRNFSSGVSELRAFSRETGFTMNAVRVLEGAAAHFQIAPENVRSGLKSFSENLYDFKRNYGEISAQVLHLAPDLHDQLRKASPDKALDIALDYLSRVDNRKTAGRISQLLFGTDQIARFGQKGAAELRKVLAEVYSKIGNVSEEDARKAETFEKAILQIGNSLSGLGKTIAVEVIPKVVPLIERLDQFIAQNNGTVGEGLAKAIVGIGEGAQAVNAAVSSSIGWDGLVKGYVAMRLVDTAAGLAQIALALRAVGSAASAPLLAGIIANPAAAAAIVAIATIALSAGRGKPAGVGPADSTKGQLALSAELNQVEADIAAAQAGKDPSRVAELQMRAAALRALIKEAAEKGVRAGLDKAASSAAAPSMGVGATPFGGGGGATPLGGMGGGASAGGGSSPSAGAGGGTGRIGGGRTSGGALPPGQTRSGLDDLIRDTEGLPGGRARITATNDAFHHRLPYTSQHTRGLAFDQVLKDPKQHAAAAEFIRKRFEAAGLSGKDFTILDEYAKPSPFSTGPHLHAQFNSPEAAQRYADFVSGRSPGGTAYKAAQEAGIVSGGAAQGGKRGATLDLTLGATPTQATNNQVPLFRQIEMNTGRSMIRAGADE